MNILISSVRRFGPKLCMRFNMHVYSYLKITRVLNPVRRCHLLCVCCIITSCLTSEIVESISEFQQMNYLRVMVFQVNSRHLPPQTYHVRYRSSSNPSKTNSKKDGKDFTESAQS
uniref:Uncharacterized protein LOC102807064 n=1 Tax=Saccoglossus kowalevskii TaxID=10224 RepID=A0ABM0ME70_SACKO|nr:PREDICTED: uncharacterized protein LOC102807064 [Saccoglossus kowalevskii]